MSHGVPILVTRPELAPQREHWAILKFTEHSTSTYTENDGSVTAVAYEAYLDRDAWLAEVQHLTDRRRESYATAFFACLIKPATIKVTVAVDVGGA